ncbi:MAG: hypothetical protein WAL56_22545 [Candidatus Sulfotelmatobacter sp.]
MTLVVSARIPEGAVIGVDSLSTASAALQAVINTKMKCKQCGSDNDLANVQLPPLQFPVSMPEEPLIVSLMGQYWALMGNAEQALECAARACGTAKTFGHAHHT